MGRGRNTAMRTAEGSRKTPRPVPELVGLTVGDALSLAGVFGLVLIAPDPDGPSLIVVAGSGLSRIVWQMPRPGAPCRPGHPVLVGYEPEEDGGSGVREPRQPLPTLPCAAARSPMTANAFEQRGCPPAPHRSHESSTSLLAAAPVTGRLQAIPDTTN